MRVPIGVGLLLLLGCGDAAAPGSTAAPAGPAMVAAAAPGSAAASSLPKGALAPARRPPQRPLSREDLEPGPRSADPFHPGLRTEPPACRSCPADRYGLEQLQLSAIIGGGAAGKRARALFVDPSGQGHIVRLGDRFARSCAHVERVLSDRVIFRLEDERGARRDEARQVVLLHPAVASDAPAPCPVQGG